MLSWSSRGARLCQRCFCQARQLGLVHHASKARTFCASQLLRNGRSKKDKTLLTQYAQPVGQVAKKLRIDPDGPDAEARELKGRITRLEQELKALQKGLLFSDSPLFSHLTDAERAKVALVVQKGSNPFLDAPALVPDNTKLQNLQSPPPESTTDQDNSAEYVPDKDGLTIQLPLFEEDDVSLARLNACLRQAARNTSDGEARRELWRWYSRCKQSLPSLLHIIPELAWKVLWASQQHVSPSNPDRAAHLKVLAEDILASGRLLDDGQRLAYMESMFLEDDLDRALQEWESNVETLGMEGRTSQEYWALGVRTYAAQGMPQKAQETANRFLFQCGGDDIRILIPVIAAWARQRDESGFRKAWSLYVRVKAQLGADIRMEDYDNVSMSFMNTGRTDLALAVFKDLMLTGKVSAEDPTTVYKRALGVVGSLQTFSNEGSELNNVSMTALTTLPRRFQNKFFYGSWLKKLLGMGEVHAAAMVVELMYERGVKPDPKHLNGIIGAWLRIGDAESREKAERMGWAMIQERLDLVRRRHSGDGSNGMSSKPSVQDFEGPQVPAFLQRTVSRATIDTFSLLVLYYSRRTMYSHVRHLTKLLAMAEIPPNTYFMNHLLYSELRKKDYAAAWTLFTHMRKSVGADMETFACLWDCEKQRVDTSRVHSSEYFPKPRPLFEVMITWHSKASSRERNMAREDFTKELYDQIIRCFSLSKDLEGTLVAMHVMRQSIGMYPDQDTARMIALHISRLKSSESEVRRTRRSRLAGSQNSRADVAKITKILEMLTERRMKALADRGMKLEYLNKEQQADEQLYLMSELLRVVMSRTARDASTVEKDIEKAAWDMGVGGITIEDPLDSTRT